MQTIVSLAYQYRLLPFTPSKVEQWARQGKLKLLQTAASYGLYNIRLAVITGIGQHPHPALLPLASALIDDAVPLVSEMAMQTVLAQTPAPGKPLLDRITAKRKHWADKEAAENYLSKEAWLRYSGGDDESPEGRQRPSERLIRNLQDMQSSNYMY